MVLLKVFIGTLKDLQVLVKNRRIARAMKASGNGDIVFKEDDGEYEKGDTFLSFHRQARRPLSRRALLACYLSA